MKTKLLVEQHFHGAFGIDFNQCSIDDILFLTKEIYKYGIGGIFPTVVTDSVERTKLAISKIKSAAQKQSAGMAKIFGVHLEGIFLNPDKKGIHNEKYFLTPTVDNYKLIEDNFIKIVTLAPELADSELYDYLRTRRVKIQAGHCTGGDLSRCDGVTHTFNAMSGITHRGKSTALSALIDDRLFAEIIADGIHTSLDTLKLFFKSKPANRVILVSDSLPCTKSDVKEFNFAGERIFFDGLRATSQSGTLAGSTNLLPDIIKYLGSHGLLNPEYIETPYNYHDIDLQGEIEWDDEFNIVSLKG